jgi:hypothetical protein
MKAHFLVAVAVFSAAGWVAADGSDPVLAVFRIQAEMEKRLVNADLASLERTQTQLRTATDRLMRLGDDLARAEKDGEDLGSLKARSTDLGKAEAEVSELVAAAQQLRNDIVARRSYLEEVQSEIKLLEETGPVISDELSGRWSVAIEPGAFHGTFDLRLEGTIVTGVYQLSGGWKGSLRGTFVGGNVHLERIDTQQGFVSTYDGRLVPREGGKRLEGTWQATNLAAGTPSSGTWAGRREESQ